LRVPNPLDHDFRRFNQWQAGERVPIEQPAMRQPQHPLDREVEAQMDLVDGAEQVSTLENDFDRVSSSFIDESDDDFSQDMLSQDMDANEKSINSQPSFFSPKRTQEEIEFKSFFSGMRKFYRKLF
jgi:hypothetical protein